MQPICWQRELRVPCLSTGSDDRCSSISPQAHEKVESEIQLSREKGTAIAARHICRCSGAVKSIFLEQQAPGLTRRATSSEQLSLYVDISKRKRAEEALLRAEEKYRDIFENSVTGIYQIGLNGDFVRVNAALARIHGYDSPDEMLNEVKNSLQIHSIPNAL